MRKHFLFITLVALFLMVACGDDTKTTTDNNVTPDDEVADDVVVDETVTDDTTIDETVTDTVATDNAVTDETVTDETGDDILNDNEQPDEDMAPDPLVQHLVGVWAQKVELFADGNVPVVNDVVLRTDKIVRIIIKEEGGKAVLADRPQTCYMETVIVEGNSIAKTITTYFPEKFRNYFFYIPPEDLKDPKPALEYSGTPDNFSFKMNRWWEMRGAYFQGENGTTPFDIETEMITETDDPRIFDHDEDGKAGMTFEIKSSIASGLIWGVIKSYMEVTSTSAVNDRIEGSSLWQQYEMVIDVDNPLFAGDRTIQPHTEGNTMVMVRIDPADDCAAINEKKDTLFKK
ncbi:MAG TPA: hypothetical protein PKH10_07960 [bacterium]|nr:hypothetical protein [bacterium]